MRPVTLPHHRTCGFPHPAVEPSRIRSRQDRTETERLLPSTSRTLLSVERFAKHRHRLAAVGLPRLHRVGPQRSRVGYRSCRARDSSSFIAPVFSPFSSSVLWFFGPSLQSHYRTFFATTASADFSSALTEEISPGKVRILSPRAAWLYLMRLDDLWASLFRASLPPAPGLTASSYTCGRRFASRFFRLRLAATPCVSATVAVVGSGWLLSSNENSAHAGHTLRRRLTPPFARHRKLAGQHRAPCGR